MQEAVVVAVNPDTREIGGPVPLLAAHTMPGTCHLAVSVQLIDGEGRWLITQRAATKRSFASLWTNTCCTHPYVDEDPAAAGKRRLFEELGIRLDVELEFAGDFVYRAEDEKSGLVEHEWDHVYVAHVSDISTSLNAAEVSATRFVDVSKLDELLTTATVTPWFSDVVKISKRSRS
jgi:isopentenyl-diphosphate delta-isomerase